MCVQNATNKKIKKCNDVLFLPHIKAYCFFYVDIVWNIQNITKYGKSFVEIRLHWTESMVSKSKSWTNPIT